MTDDAEEEAKIRAVSAGLDRMFSLLQPPVGQVTRAFSHALFKPMSVDRLNTRFTETCLCEPAVLSAPDLPV